jgi:formate C-acetyltransferase
MMPEEYQWMDHLVFTSAGFSENGHYMAHVAIDYKKLLTIGLKGMREELHAESAKLDLRVPTGLHKKHLLDAIAICHDAVVAFSHRYARLAADMADEESDIARKSELQEISRICTKVPWEPADSFHEALQSSWMMYISLMIEGWGAGMSFGRADQIWNTYYERDINSGGLTPDGARELISMLLIKMNGVVNPQSAIVSEFMSGSPCMQGMTIGGIHPDGTDAVNELTFLILDAEEDVGLNMEDIVVRINEKNPDEYVVRACEVAKKLHGKLKFVSDNTTIKALMYCGIPEEHARDYISTGCHNPTVPSISHDCGGVSFNYALPLELALNDGKLRITKEQIGLHTGDPRKFCSFEDIVKAFHAQYRYLYDAAFIYKNADMSLFRDYAPCPLLSSLYRGCIPHGLDIYEGGVEYSTHTTALSAVPNVGDSLAAIKKTVFDDGSLTMQRIIDALDANFENDEEALFLLKTAPKFGNNDPYVDSITRDILSQSCDYTYTYDTVAGRKSAPACLTMTANIPFGKSIGALPDGRRAGEPLAEGGISPHQGRNVNGVTSTMASVAALDQVKLSHGSILNVRVSLSSVKNAHSLRKLAGLIRVFCETGGNLVQFNFISNEMLRDAQNHPERYSDLLVRVATYSAYFTELSAELQDDIIRRNELEMY